MPNLALIDALRARTKELKVSYIGSQNGPEKALCKEAKVPYYGIQTGKLRRYFDWQNFVDVFRVPLGFFQALQLLRKLKPDLLFSKGGFVAVPVVMAGAALKIPIFIHESDARPGLATKLSAPFAKEIWLGFESARADLHRYDSKTKIIGNPIREELLHGNKKQALQLTGFTEKRPTLLIMGGSSGSQELNELASKNHKELTSQFNVIHLHGNEKPVTRKNQHYFPLAYAHEELKDLYALADLCISRAGAGSLAELGALKIPTLLFPLGLQASRGDQILNAREVVKTHDFFQIHNSKKTLFEELKSLLRKARTQSRKSHKNVAQEMAERLLNQLAL